MIVDSLRPLATPLGNLEADAENARRGDIDAIRRSLAKFGQRKPVVAKRTGKDKQGRPVGTVIAGNHTLAAATGLGWDEVAVVWVDDDPATAKAYALADNRTGELASWDTEQLAKVLNELNDGDFDLNALGWSEDELADLMEQWEPEDDEPPIVHDDVPATAARYAESPEEEAAREERIASYTPRVGETAGTVEMVLVYTLNERAEIAAHVTAARTVLGQDRRGSEIVLDALRVYAELLTRRADGDKLAEELLADEEAARAA